MLRHAARLNHGNVAHHVFAASYPQHHRTLTAITAGSPASERHEAAALLPVLLAKRLILQSLSLTAIKA